jgi:hypothetical protein
VHDFQMVFRNSRRIHCAKGLAVAMSACKDAPDLTG